VIKVGTRGGGERALRGSCCCGGEEVDVICC
jgi:hypothetical protein